MMVMLAACESSQLPPWMQDWKKKPETTQSQQAPPPVPMMPTPPVPSHPVPEGRDSLVPYLTRPGTGQAQPELRTSPPPPVSGSGVRLAMVLPLSGRMSTLGQALLNAAQLAIFHFGDESIELLVHDTRGSAAGAAEAASRAIADGASIILGPLLAGSVRAAAPAARAANVPLIAFSSDRSVAGNGVYTMGFLPSQQVHRVVAFAHSKGLRRFAILAPNDAYGNTVVNALHAAAAARGASVVRSKRYSPKTVDFSGIVRQLANFDSRRQRLLAQRAQLKKRNDKLAKRSLQRLAKLQTVGDLPFDALLIADGGKRLQGIAAHLPFYDIDPSKVRMLGTGQWDEFGVWAEPALVGGWFAAPPPAERADFLNQYAEIYGKKPPRLATLAYDAVALSASLGQAETGPDFSRAALTNPIGFAGRDGIFRFGSNGLTQRGLAVLEIEARGFKVVGEPPETFDPATH